MRIFESFRRWLIEAQRPNAWQRASKQYKQDHPACEVCGSRSSLEAHDIIPYHLWPNPDFVAYQVWYGNMITLCDYQNHGCHSNIAHCSDPAYLQYQPKIRAIARAVRKYANACTS